MDKKKIKLKDINMTVEKEETNSKVANLSPIMSVTTFNLNVLIAIKNRLSDWIKIIRPKNILLIRNIL